MTRETDTTGRMRTVAPALRRPYGTGSLLIRATKTGGEVWYAKWRVGGHQVMRRLGPKRRPGETTGLNRREAEARLRQLLTERRTQGAESPRVTLAELGGIYVDHLRTLGRRRTTLAHYESYLRVHLVPFLGGRPLHRIDARDVEAYTAAKLREGKATKTVVNHLGLLFALFQFAERRGLAQGNPVALVERPAKPATDADIRYLTVEELEAVMRAVPDDELGPTDRVLYLAAAMTGMRRGEALALRWRDVDWSSGVVRVRRSYTLGEFGPPKSRRSSRAVPMADRLAAELERHHRRSAHTADDDLVFCHPTLGTVYDPSKARRRFKSTVGRAHVRDVRFHDLRHTFGTQMAAAGAPLRAIQEWMGHSDYRTTSIYADYAPDPSQGAIFARRAFGPAEQGETIADDLRQAVLRTVSPEPA